MSLSKLEQETIILFNEEEKNRRNVVKLERPPEVDGAIDQAIVNNALVLIGTEDVAQILGCSVPKAREIMRRRDFPLIEVANAYKVSKGALIKWVLERHI